MRTTVSSAQEQTVELVNSEEFINPQNGRKVISTDRVTVRNNIEKNMASILVEKNGVSTYFDTTPANIKSFAEAIIKLFDKPKQEAPKAIQTKKTNKKWWGEK